ncbi:unnamed protein product [Cladocopium goreaui]|uniref:Uncharacterized protein n=1 Tax=Cladocopium goreaui TaxID=2562237 RepID=A0A9P1BGQ3_9DINO|nr:unnamed protein product [Cladocopium goreaui]
MHSNPSFVLSYPASKARLRGYLLATFEKKIKGLVSDRQAPADWFMALSSVDQNPSGRYQRKILICKARTKREKGGCDGGNRSQAAQGSPSQSFQSLQSFQRVQRRKREGRQRWSEG